MASRIRSIRFKIFALLLLPLLSLTGLWGFATSAAFGDAVALRDFEALTERFGKRTEALIVELAEERLQSVVWLSEPPATGRGPLDTQRSKVDEAAALLRTAASTDTAHALTPAMKSQLGTVFDQLSKLRSIRSNVDSRSIHRFAALLAYNDVISVGFRFIDSLTLVDHALISQQAQAINTAGHVRELLGQENALVASAAVSDGRLTGEEHAAFTGLVANQRFLNTQLRGRLTLEAAAPYELLFASPRYTDLAALEDQVVASGVRSRRGAGADGEGDAGQEGDGAATGDALRGPDSVPLDVDFAAWEVGVETLVRGLDEASAQSSATVAQESGALSDQLLLRLGLAGGVGLLAVLVSVLLLLRFGRRITHELVGLEEAAHTLAGERLPRVVERLRAGAEVDVPADTPLAKAGSTTEISNIAQAFSMVQRTAIEAAVGQAELRRSVSQVFVNLARRNQSLLHRQLALLDAMERKATDPDDLAELFQLDHLTTRMRRHAEGLIILSGASPGRSWRSPVRIVDVMRGAVAEIEDYPRVNVEVGSRDALVGTVVADVIHLLAELVENATAFSPPDTTVAMRGRPVPDGFAVEIEDHGLGLSDERREEINNRLATPPEFDLSNSDQLGLFVVGRLAVRHGIRVSLRPSAEGGTIADVRLPRRIVVAADQLDEAELDEAEADVLDAVPPHGEPGGQGDSPADAGSATATPSGGPSASGGRDAPSVEAGAAPPPASDGPAAPTASPEIGPTGRRRAQVSESEEAAQVSGSEEAPKRQPASFGARERPPSGPRRHAGSAAPEDDADTYKGLPRRRRQRNLAPQLRMDAQVLSEAGPADDGDGRSPEESLSLFSSMQDGWRRGRAAAESENAPHDSSGGPAPGKNGHDNNREGE